jgi:hypothetical protein
VDIGINIANRTTLVRPAIQLDAAELAEEGRQAMKAAENKNWRIAEAQWPAPPPPVEGPRAVNRVVSQSIRPALGRVVRTNMRAATNSRLAATALAIRMYQLDHAGQHPSTLDALVPQYLPAVPGDPFNGEASPLRYIADAQEPYIYSVGEDGKDDSAAPTNPWRPDAKVLDPLKAPDLFLRLTRNNAPTAEVTDPPEPETTTVPATTQP